jgi:hypothetical protein
MEEDARWTQLDRAIVKFFSSGRRKRQRDKARRNITAALGGRKDLMVAGALKTESW